MTQVDEVSSAPYEMPYVLVEEVKADEERRNTVDINSDSSRSDSDTNGIFEVTAYTSGPESTGKHPGDPAFGITASGEHVREGITAACSPSLPFGTRLEIEGVGERVCEDRGGAIGEGRLDIYIAELKDAQAFGRRKLGVRIVE